MEPGRELMQRGLGLHSRGGALEGVEPRKSCVKLYCSCWGPGPHGDCVGGGKPVLTTPPSLDLLAPHGSYSLLELRLISPIQVSMAPSPLLVPSSCRSPSL